MTLGQRIRTTRRACKMTLEQLGEAIGVSKQTVQRYESGIIQNIPSDKIEAMAKALGVRPEALMGWQRREAKRVPLLGPIACGEPLLAEQDYESFVYTDGESEADFCLRARGDSMQGARIFDGDLVFIHRQDTAENGQICAVMIDGEATLKRVYYYPDRHKLILSAENPAYPPLVYEGAELEQVRILGVAISCLFDV